MKTKNGIQSASLRVPFLQMMKFSTDETFFFFVDVVFTTLFRTAFAAACFLLVEYKRLSFSGGGRLPPGRIVGNEIFLLHTISYFAKIGTPAAKLAK